MVYESTPSRKHALQKYFSLGNSVIGSCRGDYMALAVGLRNVFTKAFSELSNDQWLSCSLPLLQAAVNCIDPRFHGAFVREYFNFPDIDPIRTADIRSILRSRAAVYISYGISAELFFVVERSIGGSYDAKDFVYSVSTSSALSSRELLFGLISKIGTPGYPEVSNVLDYSFTTSDSRHFVGLIRSLSLERFSKTIEMLSSSLHFGADQCVTAIHCLHEAGLRGFDTPVVERLRDVVMCSKSLDEIASHVDALTPEVALWWLGDCCARHQVNSRSAHNLCVRLLGSDKDSIDKFEDWIVSGLPSCEIVLGGKYSHLVFKTNDRLREGCLQADHRASKCIQDDPQAFVSYIELSEDIQGAVDSFLSHGVAPEDFLLATKGVENGYLQSYILCALAKSCDPQKLSDVYPLNVACALCDAQFLKPICERGFDLNARLNLAVSPLLGESLRGLMRDYEGYPPIMIAAQNGAHDCVSVLVEAGADVYVEADDGSSFEMLMLSNPDLEKTVKSALIKRDLANEFNEANIVVKPKRNSGMSL